ncbi:hypothetical protein L3X38_030590 [Prunus dulcis]|uniref:Glutathione S-transferase n=1 Tax=Prunus dulcis TaxID=3755 RepID=A0AAD4YU64_PRUDU|nr:hypothetical protein L3X38_030590 [Prunus dulcis]
MEDKLVLLDFWPSSYGMRVRIALAEKGIKYEAREENLADKSPLLLEMNPLHKMIPVLIHNGKPISESLLLLQYIDEVWHHITHLPCSPLTHIKDPKRGFGLTILTKRYTAWARECGRKKGKSKRQQRRNSWKVCGNFSIEAECPKLVGWARRCMERDSVSKSLPHPQKIYAFVLELKQKYGL